MLPIELIEQFLKSASSDSITNAFFWILSIFTFFGLFLIFKKKSRLIDYIPVLLTSLGILGTFTGIVSGLLNFDVNNIDSSITELLGGMKTAFLTSILGVSFSILIKLIHQIKLSFKKENVQDEQINIENIIENFYKQTELLNKQNINLENLVDSKNDLFEKLVGHIEAITKSIGSDSEQSLLGQVQRLRTNLADNQQDNRNRFNAFEASLSQKLDNFAEMLSKSATEAVIEALKQVIQDFNSNLMEQFGDNFKELNAAVKDLITWQENYKQQLEEMMQLYQACVRSLDVTEKSIGQIEESAKSIPQSMEHLNGVIDHNQQQINELNQHLHSFAELRDKAIEAIPEIQGQITSMLNNMSEANSDLVQQITVSSNVLTSSLIQSSQNMETALSKASSDFTDQVTQANYNLSQTTSETHRTLTDLSQTLQTNHKQIQDQLMNIAKKITETANSWQKEFDDQVRHVHTQFTNNVDNMVKIHNEESHKLMQRLQKEAENALNSTGQSINEQIKQIDKAMEQEVERVMSQMGKALVAITQQFSKDYQELGHQMRNNAQNSRR